MFGITDRRHFMAHAAGAAAVTVPGLSFLTGLRAQAAELKKKNKSLIILWMGGGPATIDLWDMKPGTANGGEHKPISTAAGSDVKITEHLPMVAKQFKNLSIIRSLQTREGDHQRGTFLMNTGRSPSPLTEFPSIGSVMSYYQAMDVEAMKNADIPSFISVGGGRVGPGFLGMKYASFNVQNPGTPPENVSAPVSMTQMDRRKVLFESLEGGFKTNVPMDAAKAHKEVYDKALNLVTSSRKEVFNLDKEPAALREEYGRTGFGNGCLLARKLVEAGVAAVEVSLGGWDMHNGIFAALQRRLPELDKGMSALTRDLADRGKLKDTVIVWMGDFGRTPKINQNGGRDHWPRCWSVVVGGGNIKGGVAYGATDENGTGVKDSPVDILDLYATIYKGLGIDPSPQQVADVRDNLGRPYYIAGDKPKWIKELVG
ncbi:DUF1501 domain-containing protein [Limnoglobus roseus]|uniref:DUF1501 domain-containing protein n=1 Tax=Limnoglobus roseus TaxID=2598579 RepID=A0A5C1ASA6_9BACT|nr:DUF1501 domain-containing protein [Limnoglobus roseus]QEL20973.1 hypothetical protein PX52LOC_08101 [Limnoglobus roseus]